MKLFFYYLFHSAKNALKKLFKTWVLVFFVIMIGGGLILGATIGTLIKKSGVADDIDKPAEEQQAPEPSATPEELAEVRQVVELAAGGVILLVFVLNVLGADKKGADIFQPADVNLLFASPMKPQSVLLLVKLPISVRLRASATCHTDVLFSVTGHLIKTAMDRQ